MSQRQTARDGEPTDDRILSDFSTDPELVGYSHKTWALTVLFVGLVLAVLPTFLPLPVALIVGVGALLTVGTLFSATPPHLSPWGFAHRRLTHHTQQQIFMTDRRGSVRSNHTVDTDDETHDEK